VVRILVEVDVPREVRGTGADRHLDGDGGLLLRDVVEVRPTQRIRALVHGTVVDDAAPIVEQGFARARTGIDHRRVRVARRLETGNALVEVPAERTDDADVVVVPHVAVGDDVEAGLLLVSNDRGDRVRVRLF